MPRPALTDEQRQETRRAIRKAAATLYAKTGLSEISARKVAETAGVSVGTLYTHFDNLTELMQSLWKEPVSRLIDEFETVIEEVSNPVDKIHTLLDAYADFAIEQHAIYRGAFLFVRPGSHEKPAQANLDEDRFFSLFRNAVVEAQDKGLIRTGDPDVLTQTLWAGMHGAIALPQNVDRLALAPPEKAVPHMIEALMDWLQS